MKKWFLHILLLAGLFGVLTTSCSQDEVLEEVTGHGEKEKVTVCFSIAMNGTESRSRASWNNNDNPKTGVGFENDIDFSPENFEVKLTLPQDNAPTVQNTVQNIVYWKTADNVYEFVGEVEISNPSNTTYENAKVEIFANIAKEEREFEVNYTKYPGRGVDYIPMWGIHTFNELSLIPGERNPLGTIYLLRAMAKIEVTLSDELMRENYFIKSASLNKHNAMGNLLPNNNSAENVGITTGYDMDNCFNPYDKGNETPIDGQAIGFNVSSDKKSCTIYVPEYNNIEDDLKIQPIIYKKETKNGEEIETQITGTLNLPGYFEMSIQKEIKALVRNHWYQYNITGINDGYELGFTMTVAPWTLVEKDIDYETETISIITDDEGLGWSNINENSTATEKYMLSSGAAAILKFRIETPLYCEYYVEMSGEGFEVSDTSVNCVDESGNPNGAKEVTVTIKATADGKYQGILRIFVKEDGRYKEVPGGHRYTIIKNYE